ncbi:MAG: carboxylating nicotinate-nucleotide diphosphorylase [Bacteriovoracaceae bacterium]
MGLNLSNATIRPFIEKLLKEDGLEQNFNYLHNLPEKKVKLLLKIKSDALLSGFPFFIAVFKYFDESINLDFLLEYEGKKVQKTQEIEIALPFSVALSGERLALNLLQHSSAISTFTNTFVSLCPDMTILDTRKTTPGLRTLEKYAVTQGGGYNHRFDQTDIWMIKDNHKVFFGGLTQAYQFFKEQKAFYKPIVAEIHNLSELEEAKKCGIKHLMLDNFSAQDIVKAIEMKQEGMSYEVSGGIRPENCQNYLIEGVDAFSIGCLTQNPPNIDISLKVQSSL